MDSVLRARKSLIFVLVFMSSYQALGLLKQTDLQVSSLYMYALFASLLVVAIWGHRSMLSYRQVMRSDTAFLKRFRNMFIVAVVPPQLILITGVGKQNVEGIQAILGLAYIAIMLPVSILLIAVMVKVPIPEDDKS